MMSGLSFLGKLSRTNELPTFTIKQVANERKEHDNTVRPHLYSLMYKGMFKGEKSDVTARYDIFSQLLVTEEDVKECF